MNGTSALSAVPLVCPLDGQPLTTQGRSLTCSRKHCFDIAADGHINLLPVQFKASRDPGDSKSMVQARRRVMDTGLFKQVADSVRESVRSHLVDKRSEESLIVDVGCGEGYFTSHLAGLFSPLERDVEPVVFGLDVSKWAVAAAATRHKNIAWAVASGRALPLQNGAPSIITTLFGFQFWDHWAKIQKPGGLVAIVDAGPEHLIELRELIYPTLRVREAPTHSEALASNFALIHTNQVCYRQQVAAEILPDILEMTPHGHKTTAEARGSVKELSELLLTINTVIRIYRLGL